MQVYSLKVHINLYNKIEPTSCYSDKWFTINFPYTYYQHHFYFEGQNTEQLKQLKKLKFHFRTV